MIDFKNRFIMEKISIKHITFKSQGVNLAGNLFLPEGLNETKQYPSIIFSGSGLQVKEQLGTTYGEKMAEKGYLFLAYDPKGFGDSEGEPRNYENPFEKMESIRDAISYLRTLSFVDRSKLYGLGACASGGSYISLVAVTDKRLSAIATISGVMDNKANYFENLSKEQILPLFQMANEARQRKYETEELAYYDAFGLESFPKEDEGYRYYMTDDFLKRPRPNYSHKSPTFFMETEPLTSAMDYAAYLYMPYLGIAGNRIPEGQSPTHNAYTLTKKFYEKVNAEKELYIVDGASHIDMYHVEEYVNKAVLKMDEFFKKF
jgi:fermentation-respiration switch protein FrsA (DUF1100 family)